MNKKNNSRQILVTTALPYANGLLHLGHLLEHIKSDIWVRTNRMIGNRCIFICGDDAHGTPIMLCAKKLGISPEELIIDIKRSHESDFKDFYINYDYYHTTHSIENKKLVNFIYSRLLSNGDINKKFIYQFYDPIKKMFLPDRYVIGGCPICSAKNQYGDHCTICGNVYNINDIVNPISSISGVSPIKKRSEHYFFSLSKYSLFLQKWIKNREFLQKEILNKLNEWLLLGLKDWNISRDSPYFGFKIPNDNSKKYFYVWFDASISYMSIFKKYCIDNNNLFWFNKYWNINSETELYHFIGKDVIYFHYLFWPALLIASGYRLPTSIFVHGFLTINGKKMSKSSGTIIKASIYKKYLNPEYLRYYFASKLNNTIEDIDLNFDDFLAKINSDLVGKVINIASRCSSFIKKYYSNQLSSMLDSAELYKDLLKNKSIIIESFLDHKYSIAISYIMKCADKSNWYINKKKPWIMIKNSSLLFEVHKVCTMGLNLYRLLIGYLKPVLPNLAKMSEKFLNCGSLDWDSIENPILDIKINNFYPMIFRVKKKDIDKVFLNN
ncbi:methionine--tRNA ligase [Candidatus Legionella polyplacis]|uniref:Methionine--tRNA ligase n=1 Tax=Candidatus Legionella polyplacis TaxID=2005262 RepID=A0ABZ2GYE5_9GAMM